MSGYRALEQHFVELRGVRRIWARLRGRPTRYRVIDRVERLKPLG